MNTPSPELDLLLQLWKSEMCRSVHMFLDETPDLKCDAAPGDFVEDASLPRYLWWKQVFECAGAFAVWTGALEPAWSAMGDSETESERAKQTYFDILRQTHEGLLGALNAKAVKPFQSGPGIPEKPVTLGSLLVTEVGIRLMGKTLPSMVLAVDRAAIQIIRQALDPDGAHSEAAEPPGSASSAMLARLMELEFPLAVALGRAVLPIRDVLKMTTGSVIELDRTVSDYVDLVVHGTVVARGEIVSIKGNYGVRIKKIISQRDRMALRAGASQRGA